MAVVEIALIQVRRGQENLTGIPQLAPGEFGWAQDTENLYIGKRIVEGANTDDNSRILTQKDYDNLFAIATGAGQAAVASTSTYRYRDNLDFALFSSTTTTIAKKLDAYVSLTDFGVTASTTATDIYLALSTAVEDLYANIYYGPETRRKLLIPAGNYYLSNTVDLPPYACLMGEGIGLTNIISSSNDRPLFRTVDANGVSFDSSMAEQQSQAGSKFVKLQGLTLAYSTSSPSLTPLVNFDNTENSVVDNVEFTIVNIINTSTGTILVSTSTVHGVGLSLRGERRSGIEQNKNVKVENSVFKNIGLGILGTSTVAYSKIENCQFLELQQGINFAPFAGDMLRLAPTNSVISKNNFQNIASQAIFVGTATDQSTFKPNLLNHSSNFNNFYRVGNGVGLGDNLTTSSGATAVITCFGQGFNSNGDVFSRKDSFNPNLNNTTGLFYNPLVEGNVVVDLGTAVELTTLSTGTQVVDKLFVGNKPLSYKISYTLSDLANEYYSRSGLLTITANPNVNYANVPSGSISDYYDYSYDSSWPIATTSTTVTNFNQISGEIVQPVLTVQAGENNSHLNLVNQWPLPGDWLSSMSTSSQLKLKYQINIVS